MKKVFAVLTVAAMLVAVAACGNKKAQEAEAEEAPVEEVCEECCQDACCDSCACEAPADTVVAE